MLVSIIVPVYNTEKYLDQCIQSILSQTYTDFELLLINDGSTDQSGVICDQYALKDARIKVFHQQNTGVSAARNLGLDHAKGEWVTFVDSDDWIGLDFFNYFKDKKSIDADCIFLNIVKGDPIKNVNITEFQNLSLTFQQFFDNYTIHPDFFGPCGKFFKTKIINEFYIRFNSKLNYGEDNLFNCEFLLKCEIVELTNISQYIIRPSINGLSTSKPNLLNDELKYFSLYILLKNSNLSDSIIDNNIGPSVSRYFIAIVNSHYSFKDKLKKSSLLFFRHSNVFIRYYNSNKLYSFILKKGFYTLFTSIMIVRQKLVK